MAKSFFQKIEYAEHMLIRDIYNIWRSELRSKYWTIENHAIFRELIADGISEDTAATLARRFGEKRDYRGVNVVS